MKGNLQRPSVFQGKFGHETDMRDIQIIEKETQEDALAAHRLPWTMQQNRLQRIPWALARPTVWNLNLPWFQNTPRAAALPEELDSPALRTRSAGFGRAGTPVPARGQGRSSCKEKLKLNLQITTDQQLSFPPKLYYYSKCYCLIYRTFAFIRENLLKHFQTTPDVHTPGLQDGTAIFYESLTV